MLVCHPDKLVFFCTIKKYINFMDDGIRKTRKYDKKGLNFSVIRIYFAI